MPTVNMRFQDLFEKYDVRIDRATRWGNPFVIGEDGTRSEVIAKHKAWLWEEIRWAKISLEDLADLKDKKLGCWCTPLACHGDTLLKAAAWASEELAKDLDEISAAAQMQEDEDHYYEEGQ